MPKYVPKSINLEPVVEYHIVTSSGIPCSIYDDKQLAIQRLEEAQIDNPSRQLIEVTVTKRNVTPMRLCQPSQIALCA